MALIKSISGIRGTIGGEKGNNLTPVDIVESVAGFGAWILKHHAKASVVVGRDGRISGPMVSQLAIQTLIGMGIDVIDLGLSTTPTVEMYVIKANAQAGIIFTASHNPKEWNALKFLNEKGEFISAADGENILEMIRKGELDFVSVDQLGSVIQAHDAYDFHIQAILAHRLVDVAAITASQFHVVVDCINSTGALALPPLLEALGVKYTLINDAVTGDFAHNPEPLPAHLVQLSEAVKNSGAHMGISVDPDVDRLAFVCEDGSMFGEEGTLVAIADYILSKEKGNTVSNLSSTRALADVTRKHGGEYFAAAVGEVNVVTMMKSHNAIIGGEGNGGVIVPDLHYGRDAMIGIALFLSYVSQQKQNLTALRDALPQYTIIKDKLDVAGLDLDAIFDRLKKSFASEKLNDIDGLKIDFEEGWVHFRKSNTEPIVRIYAEANTSVAAQALIDNVKAHI
ncbi:MAG TPA: phosphoglucosamine mutase [Saprospiraceae bacterium]|nr:phosphoglucosamine mutase [Saprospiraceae bacterium]